MAHLTMKHRLLPHAMGILTIAATLALSACGDKTPTPEANTGAAKGGGATTPGVPVSTVLASQRRFDIALSATGTVTPVMAVDVKPQLSSTIKQVHISEGQLVQAGQVLFTLDTRSDEANVAKLKAQLAKDEALLADAKRQLARSRDLLAQGFVAPGAVDSSQANVESQQANLLADQASLQAAQVPVSYGQIRAPSAGRIGGVPVFPGSAVQANVTTLATITRLDPIDVAFNLPQSALPDLLSLLKAKHHAVEARLPDQTRPIKGKLQFVDSVIDAASGTVKVKARFDNPAQKLWPGAFVQITLPIRQLENAVVIPVQAIVQSPRGAVVYLAVDGKAQAKPVQLLMTQGDEAAVSGIEAGDKVVVDGRQNLRPDTPISERSGKNSPTPTTNKAAS